MQNLKSWIRNTENKHQSVFLSTCLSRLRQHPGQLSSHRRGRRFRSYYHLKYSNILNNIKRLRAERWITE